MNDIINKLKKQKSILESQGYKIAYVSLYGSQNYNLDIYTDDYKSDLDMKAIVVPTLDDLINNSKPISTTVLTEWGECDLKDIRSYFETLLKGNPAYLETLFTKYYVVDESFKQEFENIFSLRDELVHTLRAQMIRAMYGMMLEKEKAMCHPYPTIKHKIDKFGYDGKQVSHMVRLFLMMEGYFSIGLSMSECLQPPTRFIGLLTDLKTNKINLEEAHNIASSTISSAKHLREKALSEIDESKIDYSIKSRIVELSQKIIKNKIIAEYRNL